jgi:uroporphyrinogen-III synthase
MIKTETGNVFFIDFVPGEPDLITLRGEERLLTADAVVYDDLVPLEFILGLPEIVHKRYVGPAQEETSSAATEIAGIIVELARKGLHVARLKMIAEAGGVGDPEIALVRDQGLTVEIVSGRPCGAASAESEPTSPLGGLRVMVTRPFDQANELYRNLRQLGAEVLAYPTIYTEIIEDDAGWSAFEEVNDDNAWLVFTSENGVEYFFSQYIDRIGDLRNLGGFQIAAVGGGTARALDEHGFAPDFVPSEATVEDMAQEMSRSLDLQNAVIVRVRGNLADETIERALPRSGATVIPLTVYRTEYADWPDGFLSMLMEHPPDAILFTSGSTVDGLYHNLSEEEIVSLTAKAQIFSLGPSVSKTLMKYGLAVAREADEHTLPGLLAALIDYYRDPR